MRALPPRPVGLGATLPVPAAITQAQTDLANQFTAVVTSGDTYLNAGETAQALQTYQAAGAVGAVSIGPEIDLSGYPQVSQPYTHKAWLLNAFLQGTASAQDAQSYVKNMGLYYAEAISAATIAATEPPIVPLPSLGPTQLAYGFLGGLATGVLLRLGGLI